MQKLRVVFSKSGIVAIFSAIYESPSTKSEIWIKLQIWLQSKGILLGDSQSSIEAAEEFGLDFVFVKVGSEGVNGVKILDIKYIIKNFEEFLIWFQKNQY